MVAIGLIVVVAVQLFRGSWTDSVPMTVISDRAGLVMNPDAKVKMRGVEVDRIAYIEERPDGEAAIHLAIERGQLHYIPSNVAVDITSSTVFGAKFVKLIPPGDPKRERLHEGQVLQGQHVTVEINTVFQQLTQLLDKIDPAKLNETLGALSKAFNGRGVKFGQMLTDLDSFLTKLEPSLPNLREDITALPEVLRAYADSAPDLIRIADNTTRISQTIVDEQQNLDAVLVSTIGLAETGNDVIGGNRQAITDLLYLLVPTTDLLNQYHEALNCFLAGLIPFTHGPPQRENAVTISTGFTLGIERYRYPQDLPKVNATGGPSCRAVGLPTLAPNTQPPFVVADVGANPWQYGNPSAKWNSDGLKQALYGPIDGPPRNATQVGQPG